MRKLPQGEIDIESVEGIDTRDYPDFVDAYVDAATWTATGIPLTEEELEQLNEQHPEIAQEMALEWVI